MRRALSMIVLSAAAGLSGCHSHYIQATITNAGPAEVSVVQVDYPFASFGVQKLVPGAAFHYRFKLLGSGKLKISYLDGQRGEHSTEGPWLNEGQEGTLDVTIPASGQPVFRTSLKP